MHRAIKPRPHHVGDATRIVAVGLVDLRLQHRFHMPRFDTDHRQACFSSLATHFLTKTCACAQVPSLPSAGTPRVFVIHENDAWVEPLRREFAMLEVPFREWFLDEGILDLTMAPPEGVFYNRMSASSHTRGH